MPFSGTTIPVLDCTVLCVFKAFFARTKDWADIEAMGEAGSVDAGDAVGWGEELLGAGHPSALRLRDTLAPVRGERP
ncbi:MAG: hypothetical protein HYX34_14120 [Actinobacteria bacterium]|nr:hypothetical protein [Actinomycetota bacterium]